MFIIQSSVFDIQSSIFHIRYWGCSQFKFQCSDVHFQSSLFTVQSSFTIQCALFVQCSVFHSPVFTVQIQRSLFKCSNPMFKSSVQSSVFIIQSSLFNKGAWVIQLCLHGVLVSIDLQWSSFWCIPMFTSRVSGSRSYT